MNLVPTISLLIFFDFFLRHPMRLDDFPLPGVVEFQRERKAALNGSDTSPGSSLRATTLRSTTYSSAVLDSTHRSTLTVSQMNRRYNPFFSSFSSDWPLCFSCAIISL